MAGRIGIHQVLIQSITTLDGKDAVIMQMTLNLLKAFQYYKRLIDVKNKDWFIDCIMGRPLWVKTNADNVKYVLWPIDWNLNLEDADRFRIKTKFTLQPLGMQNLFKIPDKQRLRKILPGWDPEASKAWQPPTPIIELTPVEAEHGNEN